MEYLRNNTCSKKRKRKRRSILNKTRRDQFEVKFRKRDKLIRESSVHVKKESLKHIPMAASAFWENYKAAHEWQNRHNVTWWKTRCLALEHENHVLKEMIRNLAQKHGCSNDTFINANLEDQNCNTKSIESNDGLKGDTSNINDNIEFHLDEDMMNFLAQSIKHKIELQNERESREASEHCNTRVEEVIEGGLSSVRKRNKDAQLLYGEASSRLLAMETALQTTVERHIDKAKPQFWPNIPLKL